MVEGVTGGGVGGEGGWTGGESRDVVTVVMGVTVGVVGGVGGPAGTTGGSCRGATSTTTADEGGIGGFTTAGGWLAEDPGLTVVVSCGGVILPASVEPTDGVVVRSVAPGQSSKRTTA
jgi:hypothetical protein